jgi:hypothetical protein
VKRIKPDWVFRKIQNSLFSDKQTMKTNYKASCLLRASSIAAIG